MGARLRKGIRLRGERNATTKAKKENEASLPLYVNNDSTTIFFSAFLKTNKKLEYPV